MEQNRHQLLLHTSMERSFAAIAASHLPASTAGGGVWRPGLKYCRRDGTLRHHGRVIDQQRPVLLVLRELVAAPWPVLRLHYRYRLEPEADGTRVLLETRLRLFPPGRLRPGTWRARAQRSVRERLLRIRLAAAVGDAPAMAAPGAFGAASPSA